MIVSLSSDASIQLNQTQLFQRYSHKLEPITKILYIRIVVCQAFNHIAVELWYKFPLIFNY